MNSLSVPPTAHVGQAGPSDWVVRWGSCLAAGATVLDLACGSGRHLRWLADRGLRVTGVDRDETALRGLGALAPQVELLKADLENGPWPLTGRRFDAVVVTNYLWRPVLPQVVASVAEGGLLIYETFGEGHGQFGRPSRPSFLLAPGELLGATQGLRVLGYEDGYLAAPARLVQRICARRETVPSALPVPLDGSPAPVVRTDGGGSMDRTSAR